MSMKFFRHTSAMWARIVSRDFLSAEHISLWNPVRARFSAPIPNDTEVHPASYIQGKGEFLHTSLCFILIIDLTTGWMMSIHRSIHSKVRNYSLHHIDRTSFGVLAASQSYRKCTGLADYFHSDGPVIHKTITAPIIQQPDVCMQH
jgi:hypothetical protein